MNRTEKHFLSCYDALQIAKAEGREEQAHLLALETQNLADILGSARVQQLWDIRDLGEPG
jgi:hypothetical protein